MAEPLENRPLYNSRIVGTYIKLIKSKYSYINVPELLEYAGMKTYEVADQGHWFTQKQINLFHERLRQLTGNKDIAREAGRFAASPDSIGIMQQYVLGMLGLAQAYELVKKTSHNFTRSSIYESRRISTNKIEITVAPKLGVKEQPFQCENRIGFFESISLLFNEKQPTIEHPECYFKGGKCCRYIISWQKSSVALWKFIRTTYLVVSLLALTALAGMFQSPTFFPIFLVSLSIFLLLCLAVEWSEKKKLQSILGTLKDSTEKLADQININYNNTRIINDIGQATSKLTNIDDMLANAMKVLDAHLDFDRGFVLLANAAKTNLVFRAGFGYSERQFRILRKSAFDLENPDSKGVFVASFREQKPILVNDINELENGIAPGSVEFVRKLGVQSFICCPIICDGESIGILAVDNIKTKRPLVQSDMSLLMGVAPTIGISIYNTNLVDAKLQQFNSILKVMASTIDARDPLTAGHSLQVTEYALGICHEMKLSKEYCEMIRVASLLHDYGKIAVPDEILKKNGMLTPLEFELVKKHVSKTREILEQLHFGGIYDQVPAIAASHHEKIDGSGYPLGLTGEQIPLGGKILAVADFFEAITAQRHYREPMPIEEAFKLLKDGSGKQFDAEVVEAFIFFFTSHYLAEPDKFNHAG